MVDAYQEKSWLINSRDSIAKNNKLEPEDGKTT